MCVCMHLCMFLYKAMASICMCMVGLSACLPTSPCICLSVCRSVCKAVSFLDQLVRPWGSKGCRWEQFGASWRSFWESKGCFWSHFGDLGVPLGAFGAQGVSKTASLDQWRTILTDFGAERVPKWFPKQTKNHSKSIKKSIKNMVGFLNGFGTVFR